jgi:hypothetical protein
MKIAILSPADVSGLYAAPLKERGHKIAIARVERHVPTAVAGMIKEGIEGVLILTDNDANWEEIAATFTKATGRPIWRNLAEIPSCPENPPTQTDR